MSEANKNTNERHDSKVKRSQQQSPSVARSSSTGERSASARIIAEQQPVMRSVAISPASHQERILLREPALQRVNPGGLGIRPPRGVDLQPQLLDTAPTKQRGQPRIGGKSKSLSSLGEVRVWHVDHASLTGRPDDFPLLRTSRLVHSAPAHMISKRISDCIQSRSIRSKFSKSDNNGNVAKCRNTDFCKFTISLYSGEDGGVLVEVHRLCGDCISFMKDCRAILNSAEGNDELHPSEDKPLFLRLPVSEMKFLKTASLPPLSHKEEADCVNITSELLSSHQCDTKMLGMESLVVQTDPLKSPKSTAIMASRMILCPNDSGNQSFNVHNYIMSLLIFADQDAYSTPEGSVLTSLEDHSTKLRNLAMSALTNALSLFAAENTLLTIISPHREWYSNVLIPKLLQDLSTAARHPFDACYASRCLSTLAESSVDFALVMKDAGGYEAVASAQEVGAREFAMLARDAGNYHNILSCCV